MATVKRIATTKQVSVMLGVKETTVQLYSRQNRIPFDVTPGGHRRYDLDEVRAALGRDGAASALVPMASSGLGTGSAVVHSTMAAMDSERRAVTGEVLAEAISGAAGETSAAVSLFEHPRRVLVAV